MDPVRSRNFDNSADLPLTNRASNGMAGYLLVDKPVSWTSHDVVAKVRTIIKAETGQRIKVGHTGTLDPAATGLLVLVIGNYTKRADEFNKLDKTYESELILGAVSSTGDSEGEIQAFDGAQAEPSLKKVQQTLEGFVGKISQTPHKYSAMKVGGQRAYKLARAGKEVELEPREITIHSMTDVEYNYPQLKFTAKVSSGTYIRSLAEDIGQKLGTGAYLKTLRRTEVGSFNLKDASNLEELSAQTLSEYLKN
jgi:tRNA pseudouridine55 synthase